MVLIAEFRQTFLELDLSHLDPVRGVIKRNKKKMALSWNTRYLVITSQYCNNIRDDDDDNTIVVHDFRGVVGDRIGLYYYASIIRSDRHYHPTTTTTAPQPPAGMGGGGIA